MATDLPLTYRQNPRPVGVPIAYRLVGDRLTVDSLRKVDEVDLRAVAEVRLSYELGNLAQRVFKTKLRLKNGRTVALTSIHWTSMIQNRDQGADYSAFVAALVRAVAAANPAARLVAGKPAAAWLATAALAGVALVGIALFAWRAYQAGAGAAALLGLGVVALGAWQLEPLVRLNRPKRFTPEAPPPELLPR